jgi:hypothetical protein
MISSTLAFHILEEVLPRLSEIKIKVDAMETQAPKIYIPIEVDGVLDTLAYDRIEKRFTEIIVTVYTDETEVKTERIRL